jgi:hypothetical protein
MFVIPSKYVQNLSPIFECVDAITQFHPTEKILVVDSYSDDVSYLQNLSERNNVIVSSYKNRNYECGSLYYAYKEFPAEKYYALIQDSIILKCSWDVFIHDDLTYNLLYFDEGPFMERELNYTNNVLKNTKYNIFVNDYHVGMFGMLGVYKQDVMKTMTEKNLLEAALPVDKFGSQMTERIFGICLMQDGIDLKKNTIDGDFHTQNTVLNSGLKYFKKTYHGRQ